VAFLGELGIVLVGDRSDVLDEFADRDALDLDHALLAAVRAHAESIAHRTGNDLQLLLVLDREGDDEHEETGEQRHQVAEGDHPFGYAAAA
jgi:hypothetical protein